MIANRQELKEYCLRKLGSPVINIEIDDTQMDDRIEDAVQTFQEQHYDGSEIKWVHYALTQDDIDSGYITIPDNVLSVLEVRPNSQILAHQDMFSYQYQITLNELSPWRPFDQVDYFMKMTNLEQALQLTSVTPTFEFVRHARKLKVAVDLEKYGVDYPFAVRVAIIDEEDMVNMFNDKWLKAYSTALIKHQWGSNVKKYNEVQLIGGLTVNGQVIFDEAREEIKELIEELETKYTEPVGFIVG